MDNNYSSTKYDAGRAGVNLGDDVCNFENGYTKDIRSKRTDKICPRCQSKRVNKYFRKCDGCKGVLLWGKVDDIQPYLDTYTAFYMWHKPIMGIEGWYHSDYFKCGILDKKF